MIKFFQENKTIIVLIFLYFLIFGVLASLRHYTFQTQAWDLAAFEQSYWNTINGKFMWNILENTHHFAVHFSPILLIYVPFYFIWPSPYTLLILQSLSLALAGWPLYLLTKNLINKKWALIITGAYFLYPPLHWINLFDFHEVPLTIPLIFTTFYYLQKEDYLKTSIFLSLTALVSENIIVAVIFLGIYIFLFKHKKFGLGATIIGVTYFILVAKVFMPALGGGIVRLDRYAQFGNSATEIIKNVILNPKLTIETVFTLSKGLYLLKIFMPLAFLPLIAWPSLILFVPGLAQNLLTTFDLQFSGFYHYDSILVPFVIVGLVFAVQKTLSKDKFKKLLLPILGSFVIISFILYSPLSPINFPWTKYTDQRAKDFRKIVKLIPANVSVATHTNLIPHLTHREYIYLAGKEQFLVDYVILDGEDLFGFTDEITFNKYLNQYKESNLYSVNIINNRYFIFQKNK